MNKFFYGILMRKDWWAAVWPCLEQMHVRLSLDVGEIEAQQQNICALKSCQFNVGEIDNRKAVSKVYVLLFDPLVGGELNTFFIDRTRC